jgi:hypothetical protein
MASVGDQGEVYEAEGRVAFHATIRDLIVTLLHA